MHDVNLHEIHKKQRRIREKNLHSPNTKDVLNLSMWTCVLFYTFFTSLLLFFFFGVHTKKNNTTMMIKRTLSASVELLCILFCCRIETAFYSSDSLCFTRLSTHNTFRPQPTVFVVVVVCVFVCCSARECVCAIGQVCISVVYFMFSLTHSLTPIQ